VSGFTVRFAVYMLVAFIPSLLLHELAHVAMAERLGDLTPRRYGRRTFRLRPHVDRFGTIVMPVLLFLIAAVGGGATVFGYAQPLPFNPMALRNPNRDSVLIALAGPGANLAVAAVAGVALRVVAPRTEPFWFLLAVLVVNLFLCVFNLVPIPGLDGSKILVRYLHGRAREVYAGMEQYLPLFVLLVFFLLAGPILGIVGIFERALCSLFAGGTICSGAF
jgi:Zn-dependent protease